MMVNIIFASLKYQVDCKHDLCWSKMSIWCYEHLLLVCNANMMCNNTLVGEKYLLKSLCLLANSLCSLYG